MKKICISLLVLFSLASHSFVDRRTKRTDVHSSFTIKNSDFSCSPREPLVVLNESAFPPRGEYVEQSAMVIEPSAIQKNFALITKDNKDIFKARLPFWVSRPQHAKPVKPLAAPFKFSDCQLAKELIESVPQLEPSISLREELVVSYLNNGDGTCRVSSSIKTYLNVLLYHPSAPGSDERLHKSFTLNASHGVGAAANSDTVHLPCELLYSDDDHHSLELIRAFRRLNTTLVTN